jgi:hypothetical protein
MALYNKLARLNLNQQQSLERNQYKQLVPSNPDEVDEANTDDYIYFNFDNTNPVRSFTSIDLQFDVNRINAILKNPAQYEYAVERFSCSSSSIPIYVQDDGTPPPDEDDGDFPLFIRFARYAYDITGTKTLEYRTLANPVSVYEPITLPNNPSLITKGVYQYQSIVNAINSALLNCVNQYRADNAGTTSVGQPFMRYFRETGNFTLYAPETKIGTDIDYNLGENYPQIVTPYNAVEIQFSTALAKLFSGLFQWYSGSDNYQTIILQPKIGVEPFVYDGDNYLFNTTDYDVRPEMEQFDKILFLTDTVPIKDELLGETKAVQQRQLFDYVITNRLNNKAQINFFPQYLKWSNLQANTELRQFTMQVYIQQRQKKNEVNNNNLIINSETVLYPLTLQPNDTFSAKVVFRKKHPQNVRVVS